MPIPKTYIMKQIAKCKGGSTALASCVRFGDKKDKIEKRRTMSL